MRTVPGSFRLPPVDVMSVREQLERDADSTGGRHRGQPPDGFARSLDLPVEICRLARSFSGQAAGHFGGPLASEPGPEPEEDFVVVAILDHLRSTITKICRRVKYLTRVRAEKTAPVTRTDRWGGEAR